MPFGYRVGTCWMRISTNATKRKRYVCLACYIGGLLHHSLYGDGDDKKRWFIRSGCPLKNGGKTFLTPPPSPHPTSGWHDVETQHVLTALHMLCMLKVLGGGGRQPYFASSLDAKFKEMCCGSHVIFAVSVFFARADEKEFRAIGNLT